MNILITGAGGVVGKGICQEFIKNNDFKVFGISRSIEPFNGELKCYKFNLVDKILIDVNIDIIVHAAAQLPRENVSPEDYILNNIIATNNLIEFALDKNVKLFIYLSAISVYGNVKKKIIDEETPICACDLYGMTKFAGEILLKKESSRLNAVVLRLPLVIQKEMNSGWFFNVVENFKKNIAVKIYNRESPYNLIDSSDVFQIIMKCIKCKMSGFNLYTATSSDLLTVGEIAEILKLRLNSLSSIIYSKSDEKGYVISYEKAKRLLNFNPKKSRDVIDNYIKILEEYKNGRN